MAATPDLPRMPSTLPTAAPVADLASSPFDAISLCESSPRSAPTKAPAIAPVKVPTNGIGMINVAAKAPTITGSEKEAFGEMLEDLVGTRGAYILDDKMNILGKVPISELQSTLNSLSTGVHAVIFDGAIDKDLLLVAEKAKVSYLIGMDNKVKTKTKIVLMTVDDF